MGMPSGVMVPIVDNKMYSSNRMLGMNSSRCRYSSSRKCSRCSSRCSSSRCRSSSQQQVCQ